MIYDLTHSNTIIPILFHGSTPAIPETSLDFADLKH